MLNVHQMLKNNDWNPVTVQMPSNITITLTPHFYKNSKVKNINTLEKITVTGTYLDVSGSIASVEKNLEEYQKNIHVLREKMENFL